MASFTDIIPQFNPYIQQLPVEAMVKVGMEKQRRYDEGVQKIQTQIDNIAGLDVVRDVDKAYLQSKLNELGNNLRTVAAGDFSNFQLVNSVSGMTNQITKDSSVQNAVSSTAWYRKEIAALEKARGEGKSSEANIWDFNQKANSWLTSNDVNLQFRDRYTPYTDVKKKAMEAIKALHPKLQQYDIPFKVVDGKINTKEIADAMQRYKIEGISEAQIKQAVAASLTPDDVNQLSIDARYQFRNVTPDQLVGVAQANYATQKKAVQEKLEYLRGQQGIVTDPKLSEEIRGDIEEYEKMLGKDGKPGILDEELVKNISNAKNNPDGVKYNIYKDGFYKEFANGFSWTTQVKEYVSNPIRQQMNWVEEMKQKQVEFNQRVREFNANYDLKLKDLELKAEENALKRIELYGDPAATDWTALGNPTDTRLRSVEIFTGQVSASKDKVQGIIDQLSTKYGADKVNEMLSDWENNQGVPSKLKKVPASAVGLLQQLSKEKAFLSSLEDKEKEIRRQVDTELQRKFGNQLQESNSFLSGINNGKPVNLQFYDPTTRSMVGVAKTPKQIVDDINSGKATLSVDKAPAGYIRLNYDVNGVKRTVEIPKREWGTQPVGSSEMRSALLGVSNYYNKFNKINSEISRADQDLYSEALAPIASVFVPQIKALPLGKDRKLAPVMVQRLSQMITATDILSIAANKDYNITTASAMLQDDNLKDTRVFIQQAGDKYLVRIKSEKDPSNLQDLVVSESDVIRYFGPGYANPRKNETMRLAAGRGNTNLTSNPDRSVMQKSFGDFPGIRKYEITADLEEDMSDPGLFTPYINIKNKAGRWVTFPLSGPDLQSRVGYEQGRQNLNKLTDDVLIKKLKQEYPNFDFSTIE
jgi:hypothetical protein